MDGGFESHLPEIRVPPPGPRSRALGARLGRVECPDTTFLGPDFPVFWERAAGANVWDADGNRYVDLTAAFGVALLGHGHPDVVAAIERQGSTLVHGMGDVHPTELKVRVAEELASLAPGDLSVTLFGGAGFEAVEAALETALLATGRPGVVAFEGAYHGLGLGALAVTHSPEFREPFHALLPPHVRFAPFPRGRAAGDAARTLDHVDRLLAGPEQTRPGAVLVEPIQGRGGIRVPPPGFLAGLREICTRRGALLVVDEILTGLGRTGGWFACEREAVVPDLLCVGKGLAGGLPLSACIGRPEAMAAWGRSTGEAHRTSTFLGNPLACAAALAVLGALRRDDWPARVAALGEDLGAALEGLRGQEGVADVRGAGLLWGIELVDGRGRPDAARAQAVVVGALREGVLVLAEGEGRNVLSLSPPFCLARAQRDHALGVLAGALGG